MPSPPRFVRSFVLPGVITMAIAACGHAPPRAARVYTPTPTRADSTGPVVPPVYVHIAANDGVLLERATDDDWTNVCAAPCDGYVPAYGRYRIAIPGREPSPPFTLPGPPGTRVALKVDDDGNVWTTDSVQLAAQQARAAAAFPIVPWRYVPPPAR
jgi:hypothetical protein